MYACNIKFDEEFLLRSQLALFRRRSPAPRFALVSIFAILIYLFNAVRLEHSAGRVNALTASAITMFGLIALLIILVARLVNQNYKRGARFWISRMQGGTVDYEFSEAAVSWSSSFGSGTTFWEFFEALLVTRESIVFDAPSSAILLPTSQVPADAIAFLISTFSSRDLPVMDER